MGYMTVRETLTAFSTRVQKKCSELARREKDANIKPDPDLDIYMKEALEELIKVNSYAGKYFLGCEDKPVFANQFLILWRKKEKVNSFG